MFKGEDQIKRRASVQTHGSSFLQLSTGLDPGLQVKVVWAAPRCRQMLLDVKGEIPGYRGKGEREGEPRSTAAQVHHICHAMSLGHVETVTAPPQARRCTQQSTTSIDWHAHWSRPQGVNVLLFVFLQKPVTVHIHTVRPRLQRKPQGWRARGAASTSRTAGGASTVTSAAGAVAAAKPRSRPGQLAVEELQARAGSQWALLAAADARTLALEEEMRKKVCWSALCRYLQAFCC